MSWFSKENKKSGSSVIYEPTKECCQQNGKGTGRTFRRRDGINHYMSNYEYYRCTKCGHTWEVLICND